MLLVVGFFIIFLVIGMPVAFAIGISGAVFFLQYSEYLPFSMTIQIAISQTQNFPLLAIPLFIFSANLMNETGLTMRLIRLASVLTGHMRGGLAQVSVVLSTLMGGVSGSAIADAAMEARIMGPDMAKKGYASGFSAGVITITGNITAIVPPSIGLILYGTIGEVSIGRLFAAGIPVGLLMMTTLMTTVSITSQRKKYLPDRQRASLKEIITALVESIWAFLFPVLLIGGIRFGLFTPAEAGAFAAVYALVVGVAVYKELTWEKFKRTLEFTVIDIGSIMFLIAMSGIFGYGLAYERIGDTFSSFMLGISNNPQIILPIIITALVVAGMFIESVIIILLFTSILLPMVTQLGVDPVHFGLVFMLMVTFGLVTPPVGVSMYTVCSIMDCPIEEYIKESVPFLLALLLLDIVLVFFPDLVLFLPNLIFGKG
ncbi:MAG: TRAP transporter large permease [Desulfobacterales bacterium]|nr:MAG: TRAP transporter large permease [Desulfobacterales bacterium]